MKAQANTKGVSVCFVCLGNICRSPMAEAVFAHTVQQTQVDIAITRIDSCGTAGYHVGDAPDPRTIETCRKHDIPISHSAQQLDSSFFYSFDYLLVMDEENLENVNRARPANAKARVQLFGDYDTASPPDRIIRDPYYGGKEGFERNFQQVTRCSLGFLAHLCKNQMN